MVSYKNLSESQSKLGPQNDLEVTKYLINTEDFDINRFLGYDLVTADSRQQGEEQFQTKLKRADYDDQYSD